MKQPLTYTKSIVQTMQTMRLKGEIGFTEILLSIIFNNTIQKVAAYVIY